MKTLHQSLIDYEMALLQAIADCRGVSLPTASKREAISLLTDAILSPTAMAIILADLSPEEREAFHFLLDQDGQIESARFTRQFGVIRPMGPARLERDRPWHKPVNPSEGLWYKALIFKAFQTTLHGNSELIYIPTDLLPLIHFTSVDDLSAPVENLPRSDPANDEETQPSGPAKIFQFPTQSQSQTHISQSPSAFAPSSGDKTPHKRNVQTPYLTLTQTPAIIISSEGRLRESMFSLLVYLQTNPVKFKDGLLAPKDLTDLTACLPPAPGSQYFLPIELDFLIHLGQRTGLLELKHGRLRPEREATRAWLQAHHLEQVQLLQNTWRADPIWNDLWHVPGLTFQPTGWENSPLLARSKILGYLAKEELPAGSWLSLDSFVAAIKRLDPDFQRPNSDYESWYIYDAEGRALMGFEHWDLVEGALILFMIKQLLFLLGVVDLGLPDRGERPHSFRITPQGETFLANRPLGQPPSEKNVFIRVTAGFQAQVPHRVNLYDRFQLARFAELDQRQDNRVIYKITQASVGRALRNGVTADQIVAFLARATNNQTPLKVVEILRTWGTRQGTAYLERVTLLRLKHKDQVEEIYQHPMLKPLLGEAIGPTTILVPSENTLAVRKILIELGYLTRKE